MDIEMAGPSNEQNRTDDLNIENVLTNKFLNGEMSFAEYSSEWYGGDDEDDDSEEENRTSDDETKMTLNNKHNKATKRRRKYTRLSAALSGLMGEANLRFVRGDFETAEKMCHEIIKQMPTAPEPYQTLAHIHENDEEMSLQFSLLAAHLSRSDANEWLRIAEILKKKKDYRQQMLCYTQAIAAEPQNLDIHLKRLDLLTSLEESKYPVSNLNISRGKCYHKIVASLPPTEKKTIMKYAKLGVTFYHDLGEMDRAFSIMNLAYSKCCAEFSLEDINIYLELLIGQRQYQKCIDVFVASVGVEIEAEIQTLKNDDNEIEEHTNYLNCSIPDNLPIDLKTKLLICFIHLGAVSLVQTLLNDFLTNDVEKAGDLYMDVEEAFSSMGHHEMAMQLLEPLVKNTSFDLGAVWLKHAECLYNLGRETDAIESYYKVLHHAPHHPEARRKLFSILEKNGKIEEALNILQQDYKYIVNASLLYEQCIALKKYERPLQYLEVGEALLTKSLTKFRHPEELKIACRTKGGVELIHEFRTMRGENPCNENDLQFDEGDTFKLKPQDEWNFFKELLSIACAHKQYIVMERLTFSALLLKKAPTYRSDIDFYCFQACLLNSDYPNAFRFIREYVQKNQGSRSWNLLNLVINLLDENTHCKFLSRLFQRDHHVVRSLFLGNNFLTSGRYLVALKYFLEYHERFREPISALLVAITILVMAAQRTVDKHHHLILQGMSYLQSYKQLRKCDQETNYNLGRAYQMLNINNLAAEYYERALACGKITDCPKHGTIDLTKETAYNLYILYKDQSPEIARRYMFKYLVI